MKVSSRSILTALVSLLACTGASLAHADVVADWLASKLPAPPVTYSGPAQELKFGHPAPPASIVPPLWRAGIERVAAVTNKKLLFKEYGAGTLIGPKDGFKAVRSGVAEWATCYVQYEGKGLAMNHVWELPFVTPTNPMAGVRISQELAGKYFAQEFTKQGVIFAGGAIFNPTDVMSKKPIRKLEDLQGMKILAQGFSPEAAKALGTTLVNIPYPEIYTAFQQGLVDALFWVDSGYIPYKIYEVAKYHTTLGLSGAGIHHCYNPAWFNKLSPDLQKAFYSQQEPLGMAMTKITQIDYSKTAKATYKEKGVEMITLPPAELQRFRDKMAPVVTQWAADLEKDGLPAKALLADIRRLTEKYNAMSPDELMKLSTESPVQGIK